MADISVIVPTLNEEKKIERCLKFIRSQKTALDFELIVADSNSQDRTLDFSEKYADKIINVKKKGIWRARNAGAKKARSKFLCFIDADTLIPKNYLSCAYPVIDGDNSITGLSCAFTFDRHSKSLRMVESVCNNYLLMQGMRGRGEILGFNNVINKKYFEKVKGFPNKPLEDGALSIKLRKIGKIVYLPEPRVVTSSRRFRNGGILKTTVYYTGLSIATNIPFNKIKKIFPYQKIN